MLMIYGLLIKCWGREMYTQRDIEASYTSILLLLCNYMVEYSMVKP